jgi:hypothetical protein
MRFRCDEPKAKLRRVFFMRQEPAFSRRMHDGEGCRGRHGLAEKFPQICHASVRLDSYAALSRVRRVGRGIGRERVRWRAHRPAVHLDKNGGHGARAPFAHPTILSPPRCSDEVTYAARH